MTENLPALDHLAQRINEEHRASEDAMRAGLQHALKVGELLVEAKSGLPHGEWKEWVSANCEFADRTARAYMRLAKELPKLDESKRRRVADLSFRQAIKSLATEATGLHELPPERLDSALVAAEAGDRSALDAAKQLARVEKWSSTFRVADKMIPQTPDDRRRGVLANRDKRQVCLVVGPNKAGMDLEKNLATMKAESKYQHWQEDIEETQARVKDLRAEADALEASAKDLTRNMHAVIAGDLESRHGPAYHFAESYDYEIPNQDDWETLCKLKAPEDVHAYIADHPEIAKPLQSGIWGDIRLTEFAANGMGRRPAVAGAWHGIGSPDWLQEHFDDGLAPRHS